MKFKCFFSQNPPDQDITAHGTSLTKKKDKKSVRREEQQQQQHLSDGNNGNGGGGGHSGGVSPCGDQGLILEEVYCMMQVAAGEIYKAHQQFSRSIHSYAPCFSRSALVMAFFGLFLQDDWGNNGNGGGVGAGDEEEDGDWSADVSEEAVSRRMKELTSGIKGLAMDADLDKTESERVDIFHDYVKAKVGAGTLEGSDKEVLSEAERLEVASKAPIVLCELLLDSGAVSQVRRHKRLLLRFTHGNQRAQKYLLGGVEKTVEAHRDALLPKVPSLLKALYDEDVVEEEVLLEWGKKVSKKHVSKALSEQVRITLCFLGILSLTCFLSSL